MKIRKRLKGLCLAVMVLITTVSMLTSCDGSPAQPVDQESERAVSVFVSDETKSLLPDGGGDVTHYRVVMTNTSSQSRRVYDTGMVDRTTAENGGMFINPAVGHRVLTGEYSWTATGYVGDVAIASDSGTAVINAKTESVTITLETLSTALSEGTRAIVKLPAELYGVITYTDGVYGGLDWSVKYWNVTGGSESAALTGDSARILAITGTASDGTVLDRNEIELDLGLSLPTGSWHLSLGVSTANDSRKAQDLIRAIPGKISRGKIDMSSTGLTDESLSATITDNSGDHIDAVASDGVYSFSAAPSTAFTITIQGGRGTATWYIGGIPTDKVTDNRNGTYTVQDTAFPEESVSILTVTFVDPVTQMGAGSVSFVITVLEGAGGAEPDPTPDPGPEPDPEPTGKPASFMNIDPELDPDSTYIIVGYTDTTKALTPVLWTDSTVMVDDFSGYGDGSKEEYTASELGLTPVYVMSVSSIAQTGATEIVMGGGYSGISSQNNSTVLSARVAPGATSVKTYALRGFYSLEKVVLPDTVTTIGSGAFASCTSLSEINFPKSLTGIDGFCFYACSKLKEADLSGCNGLTALTSYTGITGDSFTMAGAFYNSGLERVTLPTTLTSIGNGTFSGCSSLAEVNLSDTAVTTIGQQTFYGCSSLASIVLPETLTQINDYAFAGCNVLATPVIPASLESVGRLAFRNCYAITEFTAPAGSALSRIYGGAFESCKSLVKLDLSNATQLKTLTNYLTYTNGSASSYYGIFGDTSSSYRAIQTVILPSSLTNIGDYQFRYCSTLTSINLEDTALTEIGYYAFEGCSALTSVEIPATLKTIGKLAFDSCSLLSEFIVPVGSGLTTLGGGAFESCKSLVTLDLSNATSLTSLSNYVAYTSGSSTSYYGIFGNTSSSYRAIQTVILPASLKTIGDYQFRNCSTLTSINLKDTALTEIGYYAFDGCSALASVEIPATLKTIGKLAFDNCSQLSEFIVPVGSGLTTLGGGVFENCKSLLTLDLSNASEMKSLTGTVTYSSSTYGIFGNSSSSYRVVQTVVLPSSLTTIGDYQFRYCSALTSINLEDTAVTEIGYNAFESCLALQRVELPATLTTIGNYAFDTCSALSEFVVPAGSALNSIGGGAFESCKSLVTLDLSNATQLTSLSRYVSVSSTPYGIFGNTSASYRAIQTIVLPTTLKTIGDYQFRNCSTLTNVNVRDTAVTGIGSYAFYGCTGLTSLELPSTVTSLGSYSFQGCTGLTEFTIGNAVTSIGTQAFSGCTALTSAVFEGTSGWKAGSTALSASDLADPATAATYLLTTYKSSAWSRTI